MNPQAVMAVIRREFLQRVTTKAFIFSTVGIPLFLLAVLVVPIFFASRGAEARRTILLQDETGRLAEGVAPRLEEAGYVVLLPSELGFSTDSLDVHLARGDLGGALILDDETLRSGRAVFRGVEGPGNLREVVIRRAVSGAVLEGRLQASGADLDVEELLQGGELDLELVGQNAEDENARERARFLATIGVFFLYMVLILYGQVVMRAVVEEKRDRIVEIIISSIRPGELMLGKILGVGSVGLAQLLIWLGSLALMVVMVLPAMLTMAPEVAELQEALSDANLLGSGLLLVAFFVLGYFLFASLYAAAGAVCSSDEEVQQAQMPVTLLIVIPFLLLIATLDGPQSPVMAALSMFPFFSPIMMYARAAAGVAPAWQVVVSLVLLVVTIPLVAMLAGRIYKVGILMQGKRPTLPEILRWVRQS